MDGLTNNGANAKPASAMQQKQFDMLLGRAREMMGHTGEEWIAALKADPVKAAVKMGTGTLREMATASAKAGQEVDPAVLLHVGIQFVKDIAGVANAAGAVPDDQLEPFLKDVMSQSIMEYLRADAQDGLLSPEAKQQAQGMLAEMQATGSPAEPAGEAPGPDNTPAHESAETPAVEMAEGPEEDPAAGADDPAMAEQLAALRARKGVQP